MEINFGESLKELINNKNITPEKLAMELGFSRSTVYSWLNNETEIRLKRLIEIANYFNCTIEYLIGRDFNNSTKIFKTCPPFSDRLRAVMKEKGMTTYKFIKTTRFSSKHLYNWAHGTDPQLTTLIELSKLFDCTIDYLVGRE